MSKTFYHGTSDALLDEIRAAGVLPAGITGIVSHYQMWGEEGYDRNLVYLTTSRKLATEYAKSSCKVWSGEPVICVVEQDKQDYPKPQHYLKDVYVVNSARVIAVEPLNLPLLTKIKKFLRL